MTRLDFRHRWVPFVSCLVCLALGPRTGAQERVFVNAKIFTANPLHPYAEAVSMRGGKFVAVGNNREVQASVSQSAEVIDLAGADLLPGLIDSHVHAMSAGLFLLAADAHDHIAGVDELVSFASGAKASKRGMRGDVLEVLGVPLAMWSKIPELNQRFSTGEFAHQAVFLYGVDGHTGWANSVLRDRAGLSKNYLSHLSESERKNFGTDSAGEPNGFVVDAALSLVRKPIPPHSDAEFLAGGQAAVEYLNSLGITSWVDPSVNEYILDTYRKLAAEGHLTAHVTGFVILNPGFEYYNPTEKDLLAGVRKLKQQFAGVPGLSVAGIKILGDGVVEYPSQSAAMSQPYRKTGVTGRVLFDPKKFADLCIQADKEGLIVHVHAIGDKTVTEALDGIEAARKANGNSGVPHSITHLQFVQPSDFPRFKELGVIAAFQLLWASAEADTIDLVQPYVDPKIYPWQYPARSLLDAGATISGASDWFVTSPNPFQAMYVAETRQGTRGILNASQDMPRVAMLYAYTRNAAQAMNQLAMLGSIEPGKVADLTLVDRDVLTVPADHLRETKVLWTMQNGQYVYRAK